MYFFRDLLFVSLIFTPTIALSADENSVNFTEKSGKLSSLFPLLDTTAAQNNTPRRGLPKPTLKRKFADVSSLESIMMPSSSIFDEADPNEQVPSSGGSRTATETEIETIENQIYGFFTDLDRIVCIHSDYETELFLISLFSDIDEKKYDQARKSVAELIEIVNRASAKAKTDQPAYIELLLSALQNLKNYIDGINPFYYLDDFTND